MAHRRRSLVVALAALSITAGCVSPRAAANGRTAPRTVDVAEASSARAVSPPREPVTYLVWTKPARRADAGSPASIETTILDASGDAVRSVEGAVVSVGSETWAFRREETHKQLAACPLPGSVTPSVSTSERAVLVRLDGPEVPQRLVAASLFERATSGEARDGDLSEGRVEHRVEPVGSMGPYLFLRESTWMDPCGAHPLWSTKARVVDVRTGSDVTLTAPASAETVKEAKRAFVALSKGGAEITAYWTDGEPKEVDPIALEPRFDRGGDVHWTRVFVIDVPFAFGVSEWRSCATDAEIPSEPPAEVPGVETPEAVRTFVSRLGPDRTLGGYSVRTP